MARGQAAIEARRLDEALHCFGEAVRERPTDAQALACLGQTQLWLGQRPEGLGNLHRAARELAREARRRGEAAMLMALIDQLHFWSDYEGALPFANKAARIAPGEVRAHQLLALNHQQLNQPEAALEAGQRAAALAPHSAMLQVLLAMLELDAGLCAPALERLLPLFSRPDLSAEERYRAHKECARALDRLGRSEEVFSHLHAAALASRQIPQVQQQDGSLVMRMLRDNAAGFVPGLIDRLAGRAFPADLPPPAFVLGFMRSGTTLTQTVLGTDPRVFVADETDLVMALHHEVNRRVPGPGSLPERLARLDDEGLLDLRRFYWQRARARFGADLDGRLLVDKTTMNTVDLGLIHTIFPDARVVFVTRDPCDVVLSCYQQTMVPTPSTVPLLEWESAARFYAAVMDWWFLMRERMSMKWLELRYEDAVADFDAAFARVFDFLGLAWNPQARNFHESAVGRHIASPSRAQVATPLYASSVARWRRYAHAFEPIAPILMPYRRAFGYVDPTGEAECPS